MCTAQTWDMIKIVAEVKGWPIETEWIDDDQLEEEKWGVVRRLEKNWLKFKHGHHTGPQKKSKKQRDLCDSDDSENPN